LKKKKVFPKKKVKTLEIRKKSSCERICESFEKIERIVRAESKNGMKTERISRDEGKNVNRPKVIVFRGKLK
jgi:hypothetical protein